MTTLGNWDKHDRLLVSKVMFEGWLRKRTCGNSAMDWPTETLQDLMSALAIPSHRSLDRPTALREVTNTLFAIHDNDPAACKAAVEMLL